MEIKKVFTFTMPFFFFDFRKMTDSVLLRVKRPREDEPVSLFAVPSGSSNKKQKTFRLVASVTSSALATSSRPIASPSTTSTKTRNNVLTDKIVCIVLLTFREKNRPQIDINSYRRTAESSPWRKLRNLIPQSIGESRKLRIRDP
jgi:hypothetical protein